MIYEKQVLSDRKKNRNSTWYSLYQYTVNTKPKYIGTSSTLVACTISIAIMYHTIEGNHSMLLNSALSSVMHRCSTQWSKTGKIKTFVKSE